METTIIFVAGAIGLLAVIGGLIWLLAGKKTGKPAEKADLSKESLERMAREDVDHIFNDEFREELRNMGRLHFQKVVAENAAFLREDLRLTSSQLNEYLKAEVTKHLQDSFSGYDQSLGDAKQLAVESVEKITQSLDEQRIALTTQLEENVSARKDQIIGEFQERMADIVNHYLLAAVGNSVDLNEQLDYILGEMKRNQDAMQKDMLQ